MNRCIIVTGLAAALTACGNPSGKNKDQLPNIVYILSDDLGYGDLSCYNENSKIITPNIDRLAGEGMKFTDAHTSSAVCTPTRYGIITGRYNWRSSLKSGVLQGHSGALIPVERTTIASMLQEKGYNTAFIGKWHLGWNWATKSPPDNDAEGWSSKVFDTIDFSKPVSNGPKELGFNYSFGHAASLDMPPYVYVENSLATRVPTYETVDTGKYTWWRKGPTSTDFDHAEVTQNFFARTIDFIQNNSGNKNPFFVYLALPSPHTPILPSGEWQGKSGMNYYADFVLEIDYLVGQLMHAIQKAEIEENTLVIFTSDNGCSPQADFEVLESLGHHPSYIFRGHKADIYEGGHRVPFIAKWPEKIRKGQVSGEIICTVDFMATCAEITGYKLADNEGEDSYSILPLFEGKKLEKPLRDATIHHSVNGSFAIRKGDWKLIMCPGSGGWSFPTPGDKAANDTLPPVQLYNLLEDPAEQFNRHADQPEKVEELKTLLTKIIRNGRSTPGVPQANDGTKTWKQIEWID